MTTCIRATKHIQPNGYAYTHSNGKKIYAHRWAWEILNGPIPTGMVVDHVCHNDSDCAGGTSCEHRACITPGHLRLVTQRENVLAGRHAVDGRTCPKGHDYNDTRNIMVRKNGDRECAECNRQRSRANYAKRKAVR